jgi:hypothetical protein
MRATLVDECGGPIGGLHSQIVTDGFISVAMTDNVESPDEFKKKTAGGNFCLNQRSSPELNWIEVAITLCQVMPELISFLTGARMIYDDAIPTNNAVGFGTDSDTYATASFALEVWTNLGRTRGGPACTGAGVRYGYLLLPWLIEGTLGDTTIENGPVEWTINTITSEGNDWGVGPYNVVYNRLGVASPLLAAIPTTRHRHLQLTDLAPPASVCGTQAVTVAS